MIDEVQTTQRNQAPQKQDTGSALRSLMYQVYETELGGFEVYTTALKCAVNEDLKEEWKKYLDETEHHIELARGLLEAMGLDPDDDVPARLPVRLISESLVDAMEVAIAQCTTAEAQLVACECVVFAETKDHLNWELVGLVTEKAKGEDKDVITALKEVYEEVEPEEDHHLYHTTGWCRELWIEALGLPAVLPPPEETKKVDTAMGAARAKKSRDELV